MFLLVLILLALFVPSPLFCSNVKPESQTVTVGSKVTITCNSYSTPFWYHNSKLLDTIELELVLDKVKKSDRGVYVCRGIDSEGIEFLDSSILILIVKEDRLQPKTNRVELRKTTLFQCDSGDVTFKFNGNELPKNSWVNGSTLVIYEVNYYHNGIYSCHGTDKTFLYFIAEAELIVVDQRKIQPSSINARQHSNVSIYCLSHTLPKWLLNGKMIPSNAEATNDRRLIIEDVQFYNEGLYECLGRVKVRKHYYEFSASSYVSVLILDHKKMFPPHQQVYIGQMALIKCISDIPVEWTFDTDKEVPTNVDTMQSMKNLGMYILNIKKATKQNTGTYRCIGKDEDGGYAFHSYAKLQVIRKTCKSPELKNGT